MEFAELLKPENLILIAGGAVLVIATVIFMIQVTNDPENADDIALSLKSHRHNQKYEGIR